MGAYFEWADRISAQLSFAMPLYSPCKKCEQLLTPQDKKGGRAGQRGRKSNHRLAIIPGALGGKVK